MAENLDDFGKQSGGKFKIILFLLLLMIVGVVAFFFFNNQQEEEQQEEIFQKVEEPPEMTKPFYLDLGEFVINLSDRKYFLKTTISLVFYAETYKGWLNIRLPIVRDTVISYLQLFSAKQLSDENTRKKVRRSLLKRLNSLFSNRMLKEEHEPIKKILFQEFYTQ